MKAEINPKKDCRCMYGLSWDGRQKSIEDTVVVDRLHTKVFCNQCGGYLGYLNENDNFKRDTVSKSRKRLAEAITWNMREDYNGALEGSIPIVAVNVTIDPTAEPSVVVNGQSVSSEAIVPVEPVINYGATFGISEAAIGNLTQRNEFNPEEARSFLQQSEIAARVVDSLSERGVTLDQQAIHEQLRDAIERVFGIRTSA